MKIDHREGAAHFVLDGLEFGDAVIMFALNFVESFPNRLVLLLQAFLGLTQLIGSPTLGVSFCDSFIQVGL